MEELLTFLRNIDEYLINYIKACLFHPISFQHLTEIMTLTFLQRSIESIRK